ncbi:MAG: ribosome recycling factor [Candidatus Omnitrophica bacterium]|nr:ribosome recycling factor [Candidatus Omnitrophota bacterium]
MTAKEILKDSEGKMKKTMETLLREFSEVRTGRAQPALIEDMHIDYYGTSTPVKQIAAVSSLDPRQILIHPWDANVLVEIEKAINNSKLGISPTNDGKVMRLVFPPLSTERREEFIKVIKEMAERGRVTLRSLRRDANEKIKKVQSEGHMSEDDKFKAEQEVQKMTDRHIKDIDALLEKKSKELREV